MILRLGLLLLIFPLAVQAAGLTMPFPATITFTETRTLGSHRIAIGPFDETLPSVTAEGTITRQIWQLTGAETTLQILAPLREQLRDDGWTQVFACSTRVCGGFDFRFEIDVTPAPQMFVDLADFSYLAVQKSDAWTTLLVSRSGDLGYVQATTVDPDGTVEPAKSTSNAASPPSTPPIAPPTTTSDVAQALVAEGHAVLSDLAFATGSSDLTQDSYSSLESLAAFLRDNPSTTIALVGHTDAVGSAAGNIAISRRRAESARTLLTGRYGIAPGRIETQGVGFYAPIARNDTEAGRRTNRRVEVVITSTD